MTEKYKQETPGTYLAQILEIYDISFEELIKYALITEEQLYHIIDGNDLIPLSIAQYLKINYAIPRSWWQGINEAFCIANDRKYVGVEIGHEMLINAIMFEKD